MTRKNTEKCKPLAVEKTAEKSIGNSYSDLPLFDFGVSETLQLTMDKQVGIQVDSDDATPNSSPFSLRSQAIASKSPKPNRSKASSVIPQPDPRRTINDHVETASVLLTVSDICKLLKISRSTLIRMEKVRHIPGRLMLGGSVRYHRETIEAWLHDLAANRS